MPHYHLRWTSRSGRTWQSGPSATRELAEAVLRAMRKSAWRERKPADVGVISCDDLLCIANDVAKAAEEEADFEQTWWMDDDEMTAWYERKHAVLDYHIGEE